MTMQITVTNQNTQSIRCDTSVAGYGSQRMKYATAPAIAPAITPMTTSWRMEPLLTAARDYFKRRRA